MSCAPTSDSMGRYRQRGDGGDHARWLGMWAGNLPISYDRKTGDVSLYVSRPVVPVVGGVQTALLHKLGDDADGSRARWLPHYTSATNLDTCAPAVPQKWVAHVAQACANRGSRTWSLDDVTRRRWQDAKRGWQIRGTQPDEPATVATACAKSATHALRVALNLAELLDPGKGGAIPAAAMTGAIAIVDYTLATWSALGGSVTTLTTSRREEVYTTAADALASWVGTRGGRVTRRDILRARPHGIRTSAQLDAVLTEYQKFFPGTVRDEDPPGGGPKAQVIYAPRDPRLYRPRRPSTSFESPSPLVVDTVDNDAQEGRKEEGQKESMQVEAPPRGTDGDHNDVGGAGVDTGVDIDVSTPVRSSGSVADADRDPVGEQGEAGAAASVSSDGEGSEPAAAPEPGQPTPNGTDPGAVDLGDPVEDLPAPPHGKVRPTYEQLRAMAGAPISLEGAPAGFDQDAFPTELDAEHEEAEHACRQREAEEDERERRQAAEAAAGQEQAKVSLIKVEQAEPAVKSVGGLPTCPECGGTHTAEQHDRYRHTFDEIVRAQQVRAQS